MSKTCNHIPVRRMWEFLHLRGDFEISEHQHVVNCDLCLRLFDCCLKAETFASALQQFGEDSDERRAA